MIEEVQSGGKLAAGLQVTDMTKIREKWKMPGGNRGDRTSRAKVGGWDIFFEKGPHIVL
jgi:hypothetical protein